MLNAFGVRAQLEKLPFIIQKDSFKIISFGPSFPYSKDESSALKSHMKYDHHESSRLFKTDSSMIFDLEKKLPHFLSTWESEKEDCLVCKEIIIGLNRYDRQYFGFIKDGDSIVLINFVFQLSEDEHDTLRPFFMTDGGHRYWRIRYNMRTKEFYNLEINGKA